MSERPKLTPLTVDRPDRRLVPAGLVRPEETGLAPELRDKAARIAVLEEALRERDEGLLHQLRDAAIEPDSQYFCAGPEEFADWLRSEEADEFALALEQVLGQHAVASLDL